LERINMKNVLGLIAGLAIGGFAVGGASHAADTYTQKWSGLYIGAHLGAGWNETKWDQVSLTAEGVKFNGNGVAAGGQVGYQKQFGQFVVGAELAYTGLNGKGNTISVASPTVVYGGRATDLFTVSGRLGIVASQFLIYAKGGYANAQLKSEGSAPLVPDAFEQSHRANGYVVGAGLEYLWNRNIVLGLEYNHVGLNSQTLNGTTNAALPYTITGARTDIDTVTARVSYKFGN
jgi:outer membrane immunogenic protein